jgi:hypothetical protein
MCRIQCFGDAEDSAAVQDIEVVSKLIAGTRDAAETRQKNMISEEQRNLVQPGSERDSEPVSPSRYWAQTVLIDRLMTMPRTIADDPMYQPLRHYLI